MHESAQDLEWLQGLLDRSYAAAGEHLRSITTPARRIPAADLPSLLEGVQIVDLATVTADGRPRVAPVDGLFYRAHVYFSSAKSSLRHRHLQRRPAVSAVHTRGEELSVGVHGTARMFMLDDPGYEGFRDYCYEVYVPSYGEDWKRFGHSPDIFFARIDPELMFTFRMDQPKLP
jgi:hypothetical protein